MDPITRLNASLEGRYRVERPLGEGGMAVVYLADDLRHRRKVALKVLKPDLAEEIGAERFLAEVTTTANLQHPHILPLYDSGEADGLLFYTMPYMTGATLREHLDREGALSEPEAVRITVDIAEALQVAHDQDVVHRDIKPSNIHLSHGKALLADFGIARASGEDARTSLTRLGESLGTVGYMSPEQSRGDQNFDHRADVFSLGCVLFEMLAGKPAFGGRSALEILARQASGAAPRLRDRVGEVSPAVDAAVARAMAANAADRFQSVMDFAAALSAEAPRSEPAAPDVPTVIVLPFVNRSDDPEDAYFSDGLTDEVITDLSRVAALRTISRNSAMALKGTTKDTHTLARELGITHLVTGSVRRWGDSLRITADLVDAANDTPIWSEKFSGSMEDVFGIQEHISREIVSALEVSLGAGEVRNASERPVEDPAAYDYYLRACQLMYDWTPKAQARAMHLVEQATEIAGEVPVLLAMKGQLHWNGVNTSSVPAEEGLPRAEELAARALELDPDCHLAIFVRGLVSCTRGRPERGLPDLYRAHELQPGDANVLVELIRFSLAAGLRRVGDYVAKGREVDPLSPQIHLLTSMHRSLYGDVESAAAPALRGAELAPDLSMLHVNTAFRAGMAESREASAVFERLRTQAPGPLSGLATFLSRALSGDREGALEAADPTWPETVSNEFLWEGLAIGYARIGRPDDALQALSAAVRLGYLNHPYLSSEPSLVACLQDVPGYQALLAEIEPRWRALVDWERRAGI